MDQNSIEGPNLSSVTSGMLPLFEAVSPSMKAVEAVVRELAHSSVSVLLLGERGVSLSELSLQHTNLLFRSLYARGIVLQRSRLFATVGLRLLRSLHGAVAGLR